jgi:hypothetical protein
MAALSVRGIVSALVGLAIVGLALNLALTAPQPGPLAAPHAAVEGLGDPDACGKCHASAGLDAGCAQCHPEIARQEAGGGGLHGKFARDGRGDCASCHGEHFGAGFPLVNSVSWDHRDPKLFRHEHVAFELAGAHDRLACEQCHRHQGFLGESQRCASCHANVHGAAMSDDCASCHAQEAWRPAPKFDHGKLFPLRGAHAQLECAKCHAESRAAPAVAPAAALVIGKAAGTTCRACHATPHERGGQRVYGDDCARCHAETKFTEVVYPLASHAQVPLEGGHARARCDGCHDAQRALPAAASMANCESCHADVHQKRVTGACFTCHLAKDPGFWCGGARLERKRHADFAMTLDGPHVEVRCELCHTGLPTYAERFPGRKGSDCLACHADPHGGQFAAREKDCRSCHAGDHFAPTNVTTANHQPPLRERHAELACARCHAAPAAGAPVRFVGVAKECAGCHADPHRGQFARRNLGCADCHGERSFKPSTFTLARHDPPLTGAHATTECSKCHAASKPAPPANAKPPPPPPETLAAFVAFVGTSRECAACHQDPHGGQFARSGGRCDRCHDTARFDPPTLGPRQHQPPLQGAHLAVACDACHLVAPNGVRRFAGTPGRCSACHVDPHRGQLTSKSSDCDRCHASPERWLPVAFDHDRDARFKLEGVHAKVACSKCHPTLVDADGTRVVRYRPIGSECRDCHEAK